VCTAQPAQCCGVATVCTMLWYTAEPHLSAKFLKVAVLFHTSHTSISATPPPHTTPILLGSVSSAKQKLHSLDKGFSNNKQKRCCSAGFLKHLEPAEECSLPPCQVSCNCADDTSQSTPGPLCHSCSHGYDDSAGRFLVLAAARRQFRPVTLQP
jgi:hypothetical protein